MTEEKHDNYTDQDTGQINLIMRTAVPVWSDVSIPTQLQN